MSNYNQIVDGIQDQINDLEAAKANYESQMLLIQAEVQKIPQQMLI
ncbi:hypothetical protein SynBIOSE41_02343 [Synechococcus sp. BIOS-E4-1]|nr:hypothetical protein SynBIOSE41_02343 [Synechococcus sp. BIOS-E4-1]